MGKEINKIKIGAFIFCLLEILLIAAFCILYFNDFFNFYEIVKPEYIALGIAAIAVIDVLFIWFVIIKVLKLRSKTDLKAAQVIGDDIQEAYNFGMIGLVVTNDDDIVLWASDLFIDRHVDIIDKNLLEQYPELQSLKSAAKDTVAKITINDKNYDVKFLPEAGLWLFKDTTELEAIYKYSKEQAPVVGLLSIDNYQDVVRTEDDTNDVITKLKNIIFNYCKDYGILLRRHREDTYLLLCNYDTFCKMEASHFSLLAKAREVSRDEEIPLTLSIGLAYDFPDVVKLNEMASSALDIAMSRGGDQVVVSAYGHDMEFFGGKSRAQETRNRVKTRVLADSLINLIKNASNVLVMGHKGMDMDALGACLGVKAICDRLEIKASIVVDYKLTEEKTRSALVSEFSKDELEQFVVNPGEANDLVKTNTILILCDVHAPSMVMAPELIDKISKIVVIDHHRRGEDYIDSPVFNHIDPSSSSTCEIITEFIRFSSLSPKVDLNETFATIMLAGIFLDSTYYKSKQTGVRTFEASSILKEYGADNSLADDLLKDDYEEYKMINSLCEDIKTPYYGVAYAMGKDDVVYEIATIAKAANTCLSMKGVHAVFVFAKTSQKQVRMSSRSDGLINVQLIAEKLGGGGHFTSAAATFDTGDMTVVEEQLLDVLKTNLDEAKADAKSRRNFE